MTIRSVKTDWFRAACREHWRRHRQLQRRPASPLARLVRRGGASPDDLRRVLLQYARTLARVQGVPPQTRISVSALDGPGAAAAGFEDAPGAFERPFIVLTPELLEDRHTEHLVEVVGGGVLHECGHILHTRQGYQRLARKPSAQLRMYDNLIEDERVELLVRRDSPGFACLLYRAKEALLEQGPFGESLAGWEQLADLDKVNCLVFAFIRLPHRLGRPHIGWRAINDEQVFQTVRRLLSSQPLEEAEVAEAAQRLEAMYLRLKRHYLSKPDQLRRRSLNRDPQAFDRQLRQLESNLQDDAAEGARDEDVAAQRLDASVSRLREVAEQTRDPQAVRAAADRLADFARRLRKRQVRLRDSRDGRFGAAEIEALLGGKPVRSEAAGRRRRLSGRMSHRLRKLERGLSRKPAPLDDGASQEHARWEWGGPRKTVVTYPPASSADEDAYREARQLVRPHVAAMRRVLLLRQQTPTRVERERLRGRLDPRRIARGAADPRAFRRLAEARQNRLALCLLLDESGSMYHNSPARIDYARQAAVLIAESVRGVPGIELEVYSYCSCGQDERDCRVRYLLGRRNSDPLTLGAYGSAGVENYDHQAVLTAGDLLTANTSPDARRVMLVLGDGAPAGYEYGGTEAVEATRRAVDSVRRRGVDVISVAIADFPSEQMFGAAHAVKFTQLRDLAGNLRRLLTRLAR